MSIEEVCEKLRGYIIEGDVDKFKETLTSLSAEGRLKVLFMQDFLTDTSNTFFGIPLNDSTTIIKIAAEGGHTETVKCILDSVPAADLYKLLSIQNVFGNTAVHSAAERGHTETMKCILDSVPAADLYKLLSIQNIYSGNTAVHSAAEGGHSETVKCILDSVPAADLYNLLSIQSRSGNTAVHRAVVGGHTETVKCILDSVSAADLIDLLTLQNNADEAVIHIITFNGHSEIIKSLVEKMSADEIGKLFSTRKRASDRYATRETTLVEGKICSILNWQCVFWRYTGIAKYSLKIFTAVVYLDMYIIVIVCSTFNTPIN